MGRVLWESQVRDVGGMERRRVCKVSGSTSTCSAWSDVVRRHRRSPTCLHSTRHKLHNVQVSLMAESEVQ